MTMSEIIIVDSEETAGKIYARFVAASIKKKPDTVLGLATGSSPLTAYHCLASVIKDECIDMGSVKGFALDEYVGIADSHPESYKATIARTVTKPLGLNPQLVHVPDGSLDGLKNAGSDYERKIIEAGGIDIQLLGIGVDGHIGFNEPGSSLSSTTRVKALTRQTRIDNARFFGNDPNAVPTHAITQGIGTIMRAKHLILLAFGRNKAHAVARACEGGITSSCPASVIQLHPHATIILNNAAASELRYKDYYQFSYEHKPSWQTI